MPEVSQYSNFDVEHITTPVDADVLEQLLVQTGYDVEETKYLVNGFRQGFNLGYRGPFDRQDTADNIPFTVGNKFIMWEKIMKEVKLGRYAGPFEVDKLPFKNYVQSPIGLVPKAGNDTRLIFHLSYTFKNGNQSINYWTPDDLCSVKYCDLDHAITNSLRILNHSKNNTLFYSKTDLKSAFRLAPLLPSQFCLLFMMAKHPVSNKKVFFLDKCLPFGSGISCAIFQKISNCLKHILETTTGKRFHVTNYLDDFLFIETQKNLCNQLVRNFLELCNQLRVPVAMEKTV